MFTPTRSSYSRSDRSLLARLWPRLYRLGVLTAIIGLVYAGSLRPRPPDEVSLADARTFFPTAAHLADGDRRLGGQTVVDNQGNPLGLVVTTSPHTDDIVGYTGPNNLLIALDLQQRVIGVRLLASGDTAAHVDQVQQADSFWQQFAGVERNSAPQPTEGVSGSTLTSLAMAEAIERRLGGPITSLRFPNAVTLAEVQSLFPTATTFKSNDQRAGWNRVEDQHSRLLGYAVRTSPHTDNGRGYRGPTELLIAIAPDAQTVTGLVIRKSYDTPEYLTRVQEDQEFLRSLTGRTIDEWATMDFARAGIEGVSGATQTSFAVADGLKRRFAADRASPSTAATSQKWNYALLTVVAGALVMTFTRLRTSRRSRTIWQGFLIAVFLFWIGDLLSLALLAGWMRHGVPWEAVPTVVLMAAIALVIPWSTRRQVYCQQICPHGAAQSWLGRFKRLHVRLPPSFHRWLALLRPAMLVIGLALAIFWLEFDLAWLEPFDGWVLKSAAATSATIAIVGLVASLFVPQAYCRYACPTGELLALVKSGGSHDRVGRREWVAGGLLFLAAIVVFRPTLPSRSKQPIEQPPANTSEASGQAFGTTWSVKLRGQHDTAALQSAIASELERIESTLSHWRPNSFTSQFNASETTLATEQPAELVALVARAQEISRLTGGAYDITVGPLVDAWGYGPSGEKTEPPTDSAIDELLASTGWQKLTFDTNDNTLRKSHPKLRIDLGSLLQGYAADRVAHLLDEAAIPEFLVEVGGELFARGAWRVAIEDLKTNERPLRTLMLTNSGLATSALHRATKKLDTAITHHLISPQSGRPIVASTAQATVLAPTALEADAWATALLASGLPHGLQLAEDQKLTAIFVDLTGAQQVSPATAR